MPRTKYDWDVIEAAYVTGKESLRALAGRYGCALSTVGRQASERDWDSKREQHRNTVASSVQEEKKKLSVLDRLKFDELTEGSCDAANALIRLELGRMLGIAQAAARSGVPALSVDSQDMKYLMEALKKSQDVKYRALGIPPVSIVESRTPDSPIRTTEAELLDALGKFQRGELIVLTPPEATDAQA